MRAILTIGISASGKTTWANDFCNANTGWRNINRDDIRAEIMRESGLDPVWRNWKWKWEDKVTQRAWERIESCAQYGFDIIVSDTNLDVNKRAAMARRLQELGYTVEFKVFSVSYDDAVARDNERHNGVGHSVIQKQHQQYLDQSGKRVVQDENLPSAVIVDIDGTVAKMEGHRGPFEWNKVHLDRPNQAVIEMVRGLSAAGHTVLFTSGRDGSCRDLTSGWIAELVEPLAGEWQLFMRTAGDQRKDTIIKRELFDAHINGKYKVVVVLDDRPSVCRMWRDLGLDVVQVGNPYIEF